MAKRDVTTPGSLVTRRELAARRGVHMMTVTKWEQDGLPVARRGRAGKPSLYDETAVAAWLERREAASSSPDGGLDLAIERARKEHWQAQLAEQQFQERARKLISVDHVERVWSQHVAAVRARLLAIPSALCDQLARAAVDGGVSAVEDGLQRAMHDALRELSGDHLDEPGPKTPRKAKRGRKRAKR